MCEEKRPKICLIPARPHPLRECVAGVEAENVINTGAMDKFSNEKQTNFRLFNLSAVGTQAGLCNRFVKGFF